MRSAERRTERAYLDTEPTEDPYERNYPLNGDTSGIEVNESASGYGTLTNEQKDVISAIFDSGPVTTKMLIKETGFECGNRWAGSVFGELNKVDPIPRNNI